MRVKEWGAFLLLATVWGTSFLWIKIALNEVGPFTLVAWRLLFGLAGLLVVMIWQRQSLPRDPRILLGFAFMGVFNTAVPFTLISWGEKFIDSALASILNGTVPLFTIVIAHFWLQDERLTLPRLGGLLMGFAGVVVLMSRAITPDGLTGNLWGQLAVIAASVCYATAITFSRRHLRGQPPVLQAAVSLAVADVLLWVSVPLVESPVVIPSMGITWIALVWLGVLGSCLAYVLFFYLINTWGPTRASLVTYVFPVIGLILGIVFLNEHLDARLFFGSALVVGAVAVVNYKRQANSTNSAAR